MKKSQINFGFGTILTMIISLIVILVLIGAVMTPLFYTAKGWFEDVTGVDLPFQDPKDFVPYKVVLSSEEEKIKDSIEALQCAVDKVSNFKAICGEKVKDKAIDYVCCRKKMTDSKVVTEEWVSPSCPKDEVEFIFEKIDVKEGGYCGGVLDPKSVQCNMGEVAFGTACVSCTNYADLLSTEKDKAIDQLFAMMVDCWKKSDEAKKNMFCSWAIKVSDFEITKTELKKKIKNSGYNIDLDDGFNKLENDDIWILMCTENWGDNELHINVGCEKYGLGGTEEKIDLSNPYKETVCTVRGFELPQNITRYGFENSKFSEKTDDWFGGFMTSYKAPEYVLYYEAFPEGEDALWKENLGATSYGSMAQAGLLNLAFTVIGGPIVKPVAGVLKSAVGGVVKVTKKVGKATVSRIIPTFSFKGSTAEIKLFREALGKFFADIGDKTTTKTLTKALRRTVLDASELDDLAKVMDDVDYNKLLDDISSSDSPIIAYERFMNREVYHPNGKYFDNVGNDPDMLNSLGKLEDVITKFSDEKSLTKYAKVHELMSKSYLKSGSFDTVLLSKDLQAVARGIEGLSDAQRAALANSFDEKLLAKSLPNDPDVFNILGSADSVVQKAHLENLEKYILRMFDESGNMVQKEATALGLSSKAVTTFSELGRKSVAAVPEIFKKGVKSTYTHKRTLAAKYIGGNLLYLIAGQREGLVDAYESKGANKLVLNNPRLTGADPADYETSGLGGKFFFLDKGDGKNQLSEVRPRFNLASPCKTDLIISETDCQCEVHRGGAVIYSDKTGFSQPINFDAVYDIFKTKEAIYLYDKLIPENQQKAAESCFKEPWFNANKGSECFAMAMADEELREGLIRYYYDTFIIGTIDFLHEYEAMAVANGRTISSEIDLAYFSIDTRSFMTSRMVIEGGTMKHYHHFFNLWRAIHVFSGSPLANDPRSIEAKKLDKEFSAFLISSVLDSNRIPLKNYPDYDKFKQDFETHFQAGQQVVVKGEALFTVSLARIFSVTIGDFLKAQNILSNNVPILNKTARNYYFNYYQFSDSEVDSSKVIKYCDKIKLTDTSPITELIKDFSKKYFPTKCVSARPEKYMEYGKEVVPNYCFADNDISGLWGAAYELNNYAWVAVDIGAGVLTLNPYVMAGTAAVTGAMQHKVSGWIVGQEHWPQHKGDKKSGTTSQVAP